MEGSTVSAYRRRLFLASFLMLFVELVLIRWLGAHVAYLSFFSNFVLLGSFLGIGIGFLAVGRSDWFRRAPMWLGALVFVSAVFPHGKQPHLLRRVPDPWPADLDLVADRLRCGRGDHGGHRAGRRTSVPAIPAA